MMNLIARYNQLLVTHPYKTKMATSGFLFFGGDAICQLFINKTPEGKRPDFDWRRAIKMTLVGSLYVAPILHVWYGWGPRKIAEVFSKFSPWGQALIVTALDQTVFTMPFTLSLLTGIDYLDHFNFKKAFDGAVNIFPNVIVNNWLVWPAASLINFGLVPAPFRVLFANVVGFFWNIYLSYAANRPQQVKSA